MTIMHKETTTRDGAETRTAVWAHPCAGLWVARVGGDYAGMVEHRRQYAVFDSSSNAIGSFATLAEAKRALTGGEHLVHQKPRPHQEREHRTRQERGGNGAKG